MSLHRLNSITIGVPNVEDAKAYYEEFGLKPEESGWFSTLDGGHQLRIVYAPSRRLVGLSIGTDSVDDLYSIASRLSGLGLDSRLVDGKLVSNEPVTGVAVEIAVTARVVQPEVPATSYNGPRRAERGETRAPSLLREDRVRPRKLGHVVIGSTDQAASQRFFIEGIGLKVSDEVSGIAVFMRCSTDHHNILVQSAPVNFVHHTSWEVDDVDDVGRGAMHMLEDNPERHVWGMGRHFVGSNFFWYLRDPSGNFCEYYSDLDCIVEDALWKPEVWDGTRPESFMSWGPPMPPSFIEPEDLAALMVGAHGSP
ncbi:VOC family protein [Rhodococcus sp. D-1]|uniref:VOC family protein n=1 Tax=Rhodococcus sp. D-1 TaxID=1912238 RepID=UPI00097622CC|nr:VOC family protein [Rhodococcus sp. D-1]OMQ23107.1 dioxygenase [Rhodococcus sp. D-1]